jgi:hypothetical protein
MSGQKPPIAKECILLSLEDSCYQCTHNFRELSKAEEDYLKDQSLWTPNDFTKLNAYLKRYSCLLHNYLGSFYGFVNHLDTIGNEIGNPKFKEEIGQRKQVFEAEEVNAFVLHLRGVAQHVKLAVVGARASMFFTPEGLKAKKTCGTIEDLPSLSIDDFIAYTKSWKGASKRLLERQLKRPRGREMEIMPFVQESYENIIEFYSWLHKKIESW